MAKIRRSRMHRKSVGKQVALTERDLAIFRVLAKYRYLRSTYLHGFVGGRSTTRFKERLGDLFHERFLDRPARQWEFAASRYLPVVYELGPGARAVLQQELGICTSHPGNARQFAHSLFLSECLASIELTAGTVPGVRFIGCEEIVARAAERNRSATRPGATLPGVGNGVIPDAVFGLEYCSGGRTAYRFFALEADRATMPVHRSVGGATCYAAKLDAYREILSDRRYAEHLGIPNLLVLTVTLSERHAQSMMAALGDHSENAAFLFKGMAGRYPGGVLPTPDPSLLMLPWSRRALPPIRIDVP